VDERSVAGEGSMNIGDLVKLSHVYFNHDSFYGVITEVYESKSMKPDNVRYKVQWLGASERGETQAIWYLGSYLQLIESSS